MKQNIIVIEENESVRYLLATVLQRKYRVSTFADCYEAFHELMSKEIDLVIMSVNDKDHAGFDFLDHIESSSLYSNLPVVIISRSDKAALQKRYNRFNFYSGRFFEKPFDPMSLVNKVHEMLSPAEEVFEPISSYRIEGSQSLKVRLTS